MRVLMVWSENLNKPGSGRTHFVHLARELAALGHQVRLVAPGYPPRTTADVGVPVSYVPALRRSMAAFVLFHILLVPAMPYFLLRYRPAVVYSRGLFHSFLIHALCRLFGTPYVAEVDSCVPFELDMGGFPRLAGRLVGFLDRWNLRWAAAFICVTEGLRAELIRRGARDDRVHAIDNGAATGVFTPGDQAAARQALDLPPRDLLVGFVGTLAPYQGLDLLVDAAARCPPDHRPPIRFVIVGSGARRAMVEQAVAERGLRDRVILRPAVPHETVLTYLRAMDIEVISVHDDRTLRYGLSSLKFWEALAVGLPILVPEGAGLGPVLRDYAWPGEYATGDAASLCDTILQTAVRLDACRARRQELHEIIARDHSWAAVARRTAEVFDGLLEPREGGRR